MNPKDALKATTKMVENMEALKRQDVFVGLPKDKVGSKIYGDGTTVIRIGAVHEYGATFMHPGGTPYVIGPDGMAKFVSKGSPEAGGAKVTKPHLITIPQRSFLRAPFATKRSQINDAISKIFVQVQEGLNPAVGFGRIGAYATNISKGAFTTLGYGEWKDIKESTKKRKGKSQALIDTGILRSSITWVVR